MPEPTEIRAARVASGLTQAQAAALVGAALRTWEDWESGRRAMPALVWWCWRYWVKNRPAPPIF